VISVVVPARCRSYTRGCGRRRRCYKKPRAFPIRGNALGFARIGDGVSTKCLAAAELPWRTSGEVLLTITAIVEIHCQLKLREAITAFGCIPNPLEDVESKHHGILSNAVRLRNRFPGTVARS
jgi:hypothetical protein